MGLRQPYMEKIVLAGTTLSLTPAVGESILVKDIQIIPAVAVVQWATISINRKTVGYFHIGTGKLNQLSYHYDSEVGKTVIQQLNEAGHNFTYPIADGETMTISVTAAATIIKVVYEVYDSADIKADMINGSKSDEYYFMQYGTNAAIIASATETELLDTHNPQEFPIFPFGGNVPARSTVRVLGCGFPDAIMIDGGGAAAQQTTRLKFFRNREVLFDDDKLGFYVQAPAIGALLAGTIHYFEGVSSLPYGGKGTSAGLYLFKNPLTFEQGEELNVFAVTADIGASEPIAAGALFCCLPLHVKRSS